MYIYLHLKMFCYLNSKKSLALIYLQFVYTMVLLTASVGGPQKYWIA